MPPSLLRTVAQTIRRRALIAPGEAVVVALSGGADSVALTLVLRHLARTSTWRLAGLVHVNHLLRGSESDADEAFCRTLADQLGLPLDVTRVDVRALADSTRQSIEAAARSARYECFDAVRRASGATHVATGHTLEDQAETVLLRLVRGAGGRGLSAIRPRREGYVRPLIDCRRDAVRAFLQAERQPFREDATNADVAIPRNHLRQTLLPVLARHWPGSIAALARFADVSAEDEACLEPIALAAAGGILQRDASGVLLRGAALDDLQPAVARRVVRHAIEEAGGMASLADIEVIRALARGRGGSTGRHLDIPGLSVQRDGPMIRIGPSGGPPAGRGAIQPGAHGWHCELPIPGCVAVPETDLTIWASLKRGHGNGGAASAPGKGPSHVVTLRADRVARPLAVRFRQPGDRLQPLGAPGSRKVQDLLTDRKVPRDERDRVPIVVDATGRIVWVAGFAIAENCRVTGPESGVVTLEIKKGRQ